MAVNQNTLSEIGDILYVQSQAVIIGEIVLSGFTDDLIGVTNDRFFIKTFRYSFDGINFSDWNNLNNENISNITGNVDGVLFFEFRYERGGTEESGLLEFLSLEIIGNITIQLYDNTIALQSIFEGLVSSDSLTTEICNNLIRKIYNAGILPKFIERGEGIDDEDFIALWGAICCFLAYISAFMNEFDSIPYKRKYLVEYLKQRNIAFCENQTTLNDLQFLANNFYDEIRKRGTQMIYKEVGTTLLDGSETPIRGEWLRLICKNIYDEFIVEVIKKENAGWFIDKSSVTYNGTCQSSQINKTEENTKDFLDLSKYDLINPNSVFLTNDVDDNVAGILGGSGFQGFGFDMLIPPFILEDSQLINIDKEIDYEITFRIKRVSGTGVLNFGVLGYNRNNVFKVNSFQQIDDSSVTNTFYSGAADSVTKITDEWYFVRAIIYAANSQSLALSKAKLNFNAGINLKFNENEDIEKLKICLYLDSNTQDDFYKIHDFKMRPLIRGKNILPLTDDSPSFVKNPQFVQSSGFVLSWMKNNSNGKTDEDVQNFIEEFLLPYQNKLLFYSLTPKIDDNQLLIDIN